MLFLGLLAPNLINFLALLLFWVYDKQKHMQISEDFMEDSI